MPPNKTRTRSEWLALNKARAFKKNEVSGKSVTLPVEIKNPENKVGNWLIDPGIKPLFENHENQMYAKENIDPFGKEAIETRSRKGPVARLFSDNQSLNTAVNKNFSRRQIGSRARAKTQDVKFIKKGTSFTCQDDADFINLDSKCVTKIEDEGVPKMPISSSMDESTSGKVSAYDMVAGAQESLVPGYDAMNGFNVGEDPIVQDEDWSAITVKINEQYCSKQTSKSNRLKVRIQNHVLGVITDCTCVNRQNIVDINISNNKNVNVKVEEQAKFSIASTTDERVSCKDSSTEVEDKVSRMSDKYFPHTAVDSFVNENDDRSGCLDSNDDDVNDTQCVETSVCGSMIMNSSNVFKVYRDNTALQVECDTAPSLLRLPYTEDGGKSAQESLVTGDVMNGCQDSSFAIVEGAKESSILGEDDTNGSSQIINRLSPKQLISKFERPVGAQECLVNGMNGCQESSYVTVEGAKESPFSGYDYMNGSSHLINMLSPKQLIPHSEKAVGVQEGSVTGDGDVNGCQDLYCATVEGKAKDSLVPRDDDMNGLNVAEDPIVQDEDLCAIIAKNNSSQISKSNRLTSRLKDSSTEGVEKVSKMSDKSSSYATGVNLVDGDDDMNDCLNSYNDDVNETQFVETATIGAMTMNSSNVIDVFKDNTACQEEWNAISSLLNLPYSDDGRQSECIDPGSSHMNKQLIPHSEIPVGDYEHTVNEHTVNEHTANEFTVCDGDENSVKNKKIFDLSSNDAQETERSLAIEQVCEVGMFHSPKKHWIKTFHCEEQSMNRPMTKLDEQFFQGSISYVMYVGIRNQIQWDKNTLKTFYFMTPRAKAICIRFAVDVSFDRIIKELTIRWSQVGFRNMIITYQGVIVSNSSKIIESNYSELSTFICFDEFIDTKYMYKGTHSGKLSL